MRGASIWQSLTIKTDLAGALLWQRVDQYRAPGEPALGQSGWEAMSSAAEYPLVAADGKLAFINDEGAGIGLLKLGDASSAGGGGGGGNKDAGSDGGGGGDDINWGIIGGVIGGCFVPFLMFTLWMGNVFEKQGCPSPMKKQAFTPKATTTTVEQA